MRIIITLVMCGIAAIALTGCLNPYAAQAKEDPRERVQVTKNRIVAQKDIPLYRTQLSRSILIVQHPIQKAWS